MPQAQITINGTPGSDTDLPINTSVLLGNNGIGGESTYAWSILDQPPGPADTLSSSSSPNPTFTPTKEGSYLIRLVVNQAQPTEVSDQVIAAVLQVRSRMRQPAAGETDETDTADGWAQTANANWRRLDDVLAAPGSCVAQVASGSPAVGSVVQFTSDATILAGLPGEKKVLAAAPALATAASIQTADIAVVLGAVDGGGISAGVLIYARTHGLVTGVALTGAAVGQLVYVSDTGLLSLVAGTVERVVGRVVAVPTGTTADVYVGTFAAIGSRGKVYTTYVVGNALAGDTATECDFLDPGDGSGIETAVTAMYGLRGKVIVRRGTYTRPATAPIIVIDSNQTVEGEADGAVIIVTRQGDITHEPWMTFALNGTRACLKNIYFSINGRTGTPPTLTMPAAVVMVNASDCYLERLVGEVGALAALEEPMSLIDYGASVAGTGTVVVDCGLDVSLATITPHATNTYAVVGVTSGSVNAPLAATPLVDAGADPRFIRFFVRGGKCDESGPTPYYTLGAFIRRVSAIEFEQPTFDGCYTGILGSFTLTAAISVALRLPKIVGMRATAAAGLASSVITSGAYISAFNGAGTLSVSRAHIDDCECLSGASGGLAPGVAVQLGDTSATDILLRDVRAKTTVAGTDAAIIVNCSSGAMSDVKAVDCTVTAGAGGVATLQVADCTESRMRGCLADVINIDGTTNLKVSDCEVRNIGALGGGTEVTPSRSNNVVPV